VLRGQACQFMLDRQFCKGAVIGDVTASEHLSGGCLQAGVLQCG